MHPQFHAFDILCCESQSLIKNKKQETTFVHPDSECVAPEFEMQSAKQIKSRPKTTYACQRNGRLLGGRGLQDSWLPARVYSTPVDKKPPDS